MSDVARLFRIEAVFRSKFATGGGAFDPSSRYGVFAVCVERLDSRFTKAEKLLRNEAGQPAVAGYHVLGSTTPSFDTQVDLTGRTDGAATVTVPDAASTTPDLTFFQVRAVNGCNYEGP